ncbi:hypothetical protein BHK69_25955 [Bosea vaviloviae]|uniref:Restriction endonuclease type IV Mrr domain-containing protein n=1 Tax=Bosea vaviloviae TaxID=1526658 RepID=A0A1D7U7T1_9HYPH|nr:hypothetical protein BHK69_25955 [Bosea vaviloviae]
MTVRQSWEVYERMIARLMADQLTTELCVTPNARLVGEISRRSRQIDVLIDSRHDNDPSRRVVVDAKKRKRKIDVTDVEAFRGLMEDVGASHGFLVCPAGHTKAAEKRAQLAVSICLVPLDHIPNFDPMAWPRCTDTRCLHGRIFWDGYPEFSVKALPIGGLAQGGAKIFTYVHHVGKCDRCGQFHVLCLSCAQILSVPEGALTGVGVRCRCQMPWFWRTSAQHDRRGSLFAELRVTLATGEIKTVDRRPF